MFDGIQHSEVKVPNCRKKAFTENRQNNGWQNNVSTNCSAIHYSANQLIKFVAETTGRPKWQNFTTLTFKPSGITSEDQGSDNADIENTAYYS